ncbi:MAG: hypothetical protein ACYSTR_08645 [Planctomycetota bacterium]|jgi:hypothetical protein
MHTHTYLKRTAAPIKTLCILLTVMFLACVIQLIITQIWREFQREHWDLSRQNKPVVEQTEQEIQQRDIHNSVKVFAPDGTVYLINNALIAGTRESKYIVKDQSNKILFEGKEEDNPYSFIQWYPKTKNRYNQSYMNQRQLNELNLISGEFSRHFIVPMVNGYNKRVGHWFFDTDKQLFKYYNLSGEQIGYIGANGYAESKSEAVAFEECERMESWLRPNSYDPVMIYRTLHSVYQIDFSNKQVDALIKTDNDPIRHVAFINWLENWEYDYRPALVAYTNSNKLYLHLKNPEQVIETQLPDNFPNYAMPIFAADENTIFARSEELLGVPKTNDPDILLAWRRDNWNKAKEHRICLFEVDNTGIFSEKSSFAWTQPVRNPNVVYRVLPDTASTITNSVSSPVPMWLTFRLRKIHSDYFWPEWGRQTLQLIRDYSVFRMPINLCMMAVFSVLAFLHGWPRRTHIAKLIFWVGFVFLFNLPGFLTYLALNHTPVIHCANCGKKRGLLQDICCRCGAALPLPKAKETDLVMPLSA